MRRLIPSGMLGFSVIWLGQLVSLFGSAMTGFALSIWVWQETGQATALALIGFFTFAPTVLFSPVAGALVDRWNRKTVLILSDFGSSVSVVIMLVLYLSGNMEIWHLYVLGAFAGMFNSFQVPAYASMVSTMLSKAYFTRANGMMALSNSASTIAAPVLAGLFLNSVGIAGILVVDVVTFLVAFTTLLVTVIPRPEISEEGRKSKGNLFTESVYGFKYILKRLELRNLLLLYTTISFIGAFGMIMITPMILSRSGSDELVLGNVLSALGMGGVVGGLTMSVWGGPKRRIYGVLTGMIAICTFGYLLLGFGSSLVVWMTGAFSITFFLPLLSNCNQAIWQAKIPPDVQGKVFASRQFIAQSMMPLVMLSAGPLADQVFEPAMMDRGALASSLGRWIEVGEGAGMALMFVIFGIMGILVGVTAYFMPSVRQVEIRLPDHDTSSAETSEPLARVTS